METSQLSYANKTVTFSGALASTTAVKGSTATVASPQAYTVSYSSAMTRQVSITTSASVGSYVASSNVIFTGTDWNGNPLTETLVITATGGGETVVGTKGFHTVTGISVDAQADTSGHISFGVRDVFVPIVCVGVRVGTAGSGSLKVGYADGSTDTMTGCTAGEKMPISPVRIYGDSGTNIQDLTLFF